MNNQHKDYPELIADTVENMLGEVGKAWKPHFENSDHNDMANFFIHASMSLVASVCMKLSASSEPKRSPMDIFKEISSDLTNRWDEEMNKKETH